MHDQTHTFKKQNFDTHNLGGYKLTKELKLFVITNGEELIVYNENQKKFNMI